MEKENNNSYINGYIDGLNNAIAMLEEMREKLTSGNPKPKRIYDNVISLLGQEKAYNYEYLTTGDVKKYNEMIDKLANNEISRKQFNNFIGI